MAMRGIDVSSWDAGIDLAAVPADFVIVKATQGTGYLSPDFAAQSAGALAAGRLLGCYHYVGGQGAAAEAEWFAGAVRSRGLLGTAVLAVDWEAGQNSAWGDEGYLRELVSRVIELTGVRPLVYASLSAFPWGVAAEQTRANEILQG